MSSERGMQPMNSEAKEPLFIGMIRKRGFNQITMNISTKPVKMPRDTIPKACT